VLVPTRGQPSIRNGLCAIALFFSCGALAIDPTETLSELHHTQWTTREGAPGYIGAIAQTSDGYLWLGANTGLFRFDGESFEQPAFLNSSTINGDVSALYATPSGDLWIGMRFGGAYRLRQGHLTKYSEQEGLPRHTVFAITARPDSTVWAAVSTGLYRFEGTRWIPVGGDWNYPATDGYCVFTDRRGTLWVRSWQGTYLLPNGAKAFEKSPVPGGRCWIFSETDGSVWTSDPEQGLLSLTDSGRVIDTTALSKVTGAAAAFADRDGALWVTIIKGADGQFVRIPSMAKLLKDRQSITPNDIQTLRPTQSMTSEAPFNIFEDREGNIWLATHGGLDRFRPNKLHSGLESLPDPFHYRAMTTDRQGNLWLAGLASMVRFSTNQTTPIVDDRFRPKDFVSSMLSDPDGSILVGIQPGALQRYVDGKMQDMPLWPHAKSLAIQALARDHSGALWVSSAREGLYRQDDKGWMLNGGLEGLPTKAPVTMLVDSGGKLWLGYDDNRVAVVENDRVKVFGGTQGLNVGVVLAIAARGERVWVGGTDNVSLYSRGHFWSLTQIYGHAFTGVSGIAACEDGSLWLNGSTGVTRIAATDINAFVKDPQNLVNAETLNYEDGLSGVAEQIRPVNTALESADGRIWFTTSAGAAYWIDPRRIRRNTLPPPVLIKSVTGNGRTYPSVNQIELPQHTKDVEIQYSALSLSIPSRVRFRYKLDGVDTVWQDAGSRRQAFYTNVPPGSHRFQVIAANEDGVWNETGATADLRFAPAFYQTRWFYSACALVALAALWQLYQMRVRLLARQIRIRMGERLEERERIARELHDTLLQSTQGLLFIYRAFWMKLSEDDPMREKLGSALDQSNDVIAEARDRVRELRSTNILDSDLESAFAKAGRELSEGGAATSRALVKGTPRPLQPAVSDDIYRIGREALQNAVAHSKASSIEIEIIYETDELRVRIRDDGNGIDPNVLAAGSRDGHFGLVGMRERAQRLGARLEIWSKPGAGAEIELAVPGEIAYRQTKTTPRWRRTFIGRLFRS